MQKLKSKCIVTVLALAVLITTAEAIDCYWSPVSGAWNGNWTNNTTAAPAGQGRWNQTVYPGQSTKDKTYISGNQYFAGVPIVTLSTAVPVNLANLVIANNRVGSISYSGTLLVTNGASVIVDGPLDCGTRGIGTVIQTGGSLIVSKSSMTLGTYNPDITSTASGVGLYTISGGSLQITGGGGSWWNDHLYVGGSSTGQFAVVGAGATISLGNSLVLSTNGVLRFELPSSAGITPIQLGKNLQLIAGTIRLVLPTSWEPTYNQAFTLVTMNTTESITGTLANYLASENVSDWTLSITGTAGVDRRLVATYIHRPLGTVVVIR